MLRTLVTATTVLALFAGAPVCQAAIAAPEDASVPSASPCHGEGLTCCCTSSRSRPRPESLPPGKDATISPATQPQPAAPVEIAAAAPEPLTLQDEPRPPGQGSAPLYLSCRNFRW